MPLDILHPFFLRQVNCPSCRTPVHWGINTSYNEKKKDICGICGAVLKEKI